MPIQVPAEIRLFEKESCGHLRKSKKISRTSQPSIPCSLWRLNTGAPGGGALGLHRSAGSHHPLPGLPCPLHLCSVVYRLLCGNYGINNHSGVLENKPDAGGLECRNPAGLPLSAPGCGVRLCISM